MHHHKASSLTHLVNKKHAASSNQRRITTMVCSTKCCLHNEKADKCMNQSRADKCTKQNLQKKKLKGIAWTVFLKGDFAKEPESSSNSWFRDSQKKSLSLNCSTAVLSSAPMTQDIANPEKDSAEAKSNLHYHNHLSWQSGLRIKSFSKAVLLLTCIDDIRAYTEKKKDRWHFPGNCTCCSSVLYKTTTGYTIDCAILNHCYHVHLSTTIFKVGNCLTDRKHYLCTYNRINRPNPVLIFTWAVQTIPFHLPQSFANTQWFTRSFLLQPPLLHPSPPFPV